MKVCHFTTVHPIEDVRIFTKQCIGLAENGFDVTLIACGERAFEDVKSGVKRICLNVPVKNRFRRFKDASKAVLEKALEVDADIYHFHDPELMFTGARVKKKGKIVVFDIHENVAEQIMCKPYIPGYLTRKILSKMYRVFETRIGAQFDAFVTVTEGVAKHLTHPNIHIVKNLPKIKLFDCDSTSSPIPQFEEFTLIYPGSLSQSRGIYDLLEALNLIKQNVRLKLFGKWDSEAFKRKCEAHPAWNQVYFGGMIPQNEIIPHIKHADLGVHMVHDIGNFTGGLSVKVFEFMASGIPCLTSDTRSKREMFQDRVFYCEPDNPEKIARAVESIITNYPEAEKKAESALQFAKQNSWEKEEQKLISLYNQINRSYHVSK